MALLFTESFDGILTGAKKWNIWHGSNTIGPTHGRDGTNGLFVNAGLAAVLVASRGILPATSRVIAGCWAYATNNGYHNEDSILRFTSTAGSEIWVQWSPATDAQFEVVGTGISRQQIGPQGLGQRQTWAFVELMWQPGSAYEVRVNGLTIASGTAGGSGTPNNFQIRQGTNLSGTSVQFRVDNIYVLDTSGSFNNDFLGPIVIRPLKPDGVGNRTELTPSEATDNYELVSDGDDETYVEGDEGEGDLYTFEDTGIAEPILGVVQYWRSFDPLGGGMSGKAIARSGGNDYDGNTVVLPASLAPAHAQPWDVDPDTSDLWDPTDLDAAEFGVEFA